MVLIDLQSRIRGMTVCWRFGDTMQQLWDFEEEMVADLQSGIRGFLVQQELPSTVIKRKDNDTSNFHITFRPQIAEEAKQGLCENPLYLPKLIDVVSVSPKLDGKPDLSLSYLANS